MTFDAIFSRSKKGSPIELQLGHHVSVQLVCSNDFYVKPSFIDVAEYADASYILFSAPGATGKSALAKYIAWQYNAIYWDLAKIKLGENSLHGTLMRAMSADQFSLFRKGFSSGDTMLVIDAFDEADMISGRDALEHFLSDLDELDTNRANSNVVLLARTETAQFIAKYLGAVGRKVSHYEIGFFEENNAKDFICQKLEKEGKQLTIPAKECVDRQFIEIRRRLQEPEAIKSFLGYAPVLEILARSIIEEENTARLLNSLSAEATSTDLILTILEHLLSREHDKVCDGLKERCSKKFPEFCDWESVYTPREQLLRLLCYILFKEIDYSLYTIQSLPPGMIDDYLSAMQQLLPQHPFLQCNVDAVGSSCADFVGPAFRDYSLSALVIVKDYEYLVEEYFSYKKSSSHFPSQLFFDFYTSLNAGTIFSHHLSYVYESFKSRETAKDRVSIFINSDDTETTAEFILANEKQEQRKEMVVEDTGEGFRFAQLSNVSIDVKGTVEIGLRGDGVRICNSSVICDQIVWGSSNIRLEGYSPGECLLSSEQAPKKSVGETLKFDVHIDKDSNLKINFSDFTLCHKLRAYKYELDSVSNADIVKFSHALKKILVCFRKHKKDTPAKHKERIDNVVLAHSELKHSVFEFLSSEKIIYIDPKESNLYKLDVDKMGELGLNWGTITKDDPKLFESTFKKYLAHLKDKISLG